MPESRSFAGSVQAPFTAMNGLRSFGRPVLSSRSLTPREFGGMELDEVVNARWCPARKLEQIVRHAVVAPLRVKIGHGSKVADEVRWHAKLTKLIAPLGERHVAIVDCPAKCLGKDA